MPFALGVAIADLFARIAAALRSSGPQAIGPLPPGGGPIPTPPPPPSPTPPPGGIIPEPPHVGTPIPPIPPPVVSVPGDNLFPATPVDPADCPPISLADQIALWGLQLRQERPSQTQEPGITIITPSEDDMAATYNAVTILEATDYFRFRAISTSDNVPVSFFGRLRSANGQIVPFNRVLNTAVANTLYETIVPTGPGVLLGAAASVPVGSITTGSVNAIGEVGRVSGSTFLPHTLLFSGQLDDQQALSTTNATPTTPVTRPTFIRQTAAGGTGTSVTLSYTPATGKRVRIIFIQIQGVCVVGVRNRWLFADVSSGGSFRFTNFPNYPLTSGNSGSFWCNIGGQNMAEQTNVAGFINPLLCPLPETVYFFDEVTVLAGFHTFLAGDIASNLVVIFEES